MQQNHGGLRGPASRMIRRQRGGPPETVNGPASAIKALFTPVGRHRELTASAPARHPFYCSTSWQRAKHGQHAGDHCNDDPGWDLSPRIPRPSSHVAVSTAYCGNRPITKRHQKKGSPYAIFRLAKRRMLIPVPTISMNEALFNPH